MKYENWFYWYYELMEKDRTRADMIKEQFPNNWESIKEWLEKAFEGGREESMITLQEWMETIQYQISEGSEWYCNIPNTYSLSYWNEKQDGFSTNIVFQKVTMEVLLVDVCDYSKNEAYRVKGTKLDIDNEAWDDVQYQDVSKEQLLKTLSSLMVEENWDHYSGLPAPAAYE